MYFKLFEIERLIDIVEQNKKESEDLDLDEISDNSLLARDGSFYFGSYLQIGKSPTYYVNLNLRISNLPHQIEGIFT